MTPSHADQRARGEMVELSRQLGDPAADLAILGEGNTSRASPDHTFLVKASGTPLHQVTPRDLVRMDRTAVLDIIDDSRLDEHDHIGLAARMREATLDAPGRPASIETMVHALALGLPEVTTVGHVHPTAVTTLLCSDRASELVAGALFPDQVVICGAQPLLVPYAEPGLPLARALRRSLNEHLDTQATAPRLIYLANHGLVAAGATAAQVLAITTMAVKAARVLAGALAIGRPRYLDPDTVARLDTRPDERHRRHLLSGGHTSPSTEGGR